jgi:hypothetical protein
VVYSIDVTGSMSTSDPTNQRFFAPIFFNGILNNSSANNFAVFNTWNTTVQKFSSLTNPTNFTLLNNTINASISANDNTNLNVGLNQSILTLDNDPRVGQSSKIIIFLTDGLQTSGTYDPNIAVTAGQKGYAIYSIGLGSGVDTSLLQAMATSSSGKYYSSPTVANLTSVYNDIYQSIITDTIPYKVNVTEVIPSYLGVNKSSVKITPNNILPNSISTDGNGNTSFI